MARRSEWGSVEAGQCLCIKLARRCHRISSATRTTLDRRIHLMSGSRTRANTPSSTRTRVSTRATRGPLSKTSLRLPTSLVGSSGSRARRRPIYLYYNGHGDLAAEADGSGTRTALHTYTPFGAPNDSPPANSTVHRYTGAW